MTRLAYYLEPFANVSRRLNLASRVVTASEWILDGYDRDEIVGLLGDIERDLQRATRENEEELEEAAA
jgi:hypothetical protein